MSKSIFYVVSFLATGILLLTPFLLTEKPMVSMSLLQVTIFVVVVILLTRNFFFLVLNPWYDVYTYFRDRKYRSRKYRPLVSAIVPAWNEEVGIQLTLESIWASTYKDVEIIVVDDGSTDCTASIVRRFIREKKKKTKHQKIRKTIRLIQQSNQGKGSALNRGIKDSSGEIIITFDADSEVSPTAISAFVKRFRDPQISAAMGQVRIGNRQTLAGLVQSLEYMLTFSFKKTSSLLNVMYVVGGAAAAYRRNIFSDVGYFDTETITEDIDLSLRVLTHRKVISYVENAVVYTEGASSFVSLIKQRLRWRRGRHDALLRHRKLLAKKEGAPHLLLRVVLSASIFLEALLLFEPLFFALLIFYSIAEQNFDSFAVLVVLLAFGFIITLLFSNYRTKYTSFILLSPIVWAGFYLAVLVEYAALAFSLYSLFTGKKVKWQKWDRRGVRGASSPILQAGKKKALVRKYVSICFFIFLLLFAVGIFYYNTYTHTLLLSPILLVLLFAASTDGVFLSLHLTRKKINYPELSFDPKKLSIIIACYNGAKIVPETIEQALTKVPPEQIFVISDHSTDDTVTVARSYGVQVFENEKNYNKGLSINRWVEKITTEYCLILDDDTHIKDTLIPTNLLDKGYSAVAFNVMPERTPTIINALQQYEYRKSMYLGKHLRSRVGAIGNVSGAIGLFRTKDLIRQARKHSGQFGGEDQQRTMLVHLESEGEGIVYVDSTVYTEAPDTWHALFRQRAFRWGMAVHETFVLCLRIIFSPKTHYLLKVERTYLLFILFTDPIRMVLFPLLFFHPIFVLTLYTLYLVFETAAWAKTGFQDPVWIILLSPVYNVYKNLGRFLAHFYWFKVKYQYVIKDQYHKLITDRNLIGEYLFLTIILVFFWFFSLNYFLDTAAPNLEKFSGRIIETPLARSIPTRFLPQ